jgi:hypothetical protein
MESDFNVEEWQPLNNGLILYSMRNWFTCT